MENKELRERMLSGKMYNDLSVELVQRREQAVFLTNDYNSTYGKPKEVREALLRKLLRRIGSSVHFEPNFRTKRTPFFIKGLKREKSYFQHIILFIQSESIFLSQ